MKKILIVVPLLLAAPMFVADAKSQDSDIICSGGECRSDGNPDKYVWICSSNVCYPYPIK